MIHSSLAYIDAGTGSLLIQMLTGGVAAAAVVLKIYWRRLRRFLHIGKPEETDSPS
jgi:hypothetical protein